MSVPISTSEPIGISAGDSIDFTKTLANYPASQGWSVKYEVRGGAGPIEWVSTASGDSHVISVGASVTADYLPGEYDLAGYVINTGTDQRIQFYLNNFTIAIDFQADDGQTKIETHAQQMIDLIHAVQLGKATHDLAESDVEGSRIRLLTPKELREELNYWLQIRQNEIKIANSKVGISNQRNRFVRFTDPSGGGIGQFGALPPIFPFGGGSQ